MAMEGTGIGGGGGALVEATGAVIFASGLLDDSVWVDVEQYSRVSMGIERAAGTLGDRGVETFGVSGGLGGSSMVWDEADTITQSFSGSASEA